MFLCERKRQIDGAVAASTQKCMLCCVHLSRARNAASIVSCTQMALRCVCKQCVVVFFVLSIRCSHPIFQVPIFHISFYCDAHFKRALAEKEWNTIASESISTAACGTHIKSIKVRSEKIAIRKRLGAVKFVIVRHVCWGSKKKIRIYFETRNSIISWRFELEREKNRESFIFGNMKSISKQFLRGIQLDTFLFSPEIEFFS